MSTQDAALTDEARSFLADLFGGGVPLQDLLRDGAFPDGWVARYVAFVGHVADRYGDVEPLPREVLAVIYNASVYCTKRYFDWQRHSDSANDHTEALVNQVRWAGDQF